MIDPGCHIINYNTTFFVFNAGLFIVEGVSSYCHLTKNAQFDTNSNNFQQIHKKKYHIYYIFT